MSFYQRYESITNRDIREIVVSRFIPDVILVQLATFSQWLNDLPRERERGPARWLLETCGFLLKRRVQAAANLFNKSAHVASSRAGVLATVGYARKSRTKETNAVRKRLLESMTAILVDPCLCGRIYVRPVRNAKSPLIVRDLTPDLLTKEIRHSNGGMQGKKKTLITCNNESYSRFFFYIF
ncbi:hypothetical protein CLU79DRAFT_228492 [Phycomyces nitens]|nr:hypothetical protein CLU79DRAFT_228492 [Phycomyces nitens]